MEAKDAFLGGDIRVHSKEQELSYTKRVDINGACAALEHRVRTARRSRQRRRHRGVVGRLQLRDAHVRGSRCA